MKTKPQHLICFSHLRWDFVYQRPQHLMTRISGDMKVTYIEEPVFDNEGEPNYHHHDISDSLTIIKPQLSSGLSKAEENVQLELLLSDFVGRKHNEELLFWYYTPMALEFSRSFSPGMVVYDCMDELSAFKFAPPILKELEAELFTKADLVFTGGQSLFEEKRKFHSLAFPFPSSIDKAHFGAARNIAEMPQDQELIEGIKIGFFGVIDERFDIELIREMAERRSSWQIILIGPVVKIDPSILPQASNIHYLGSKTYDELPAYLSGWDIALIPFLLNESTRFISPTKTPEYLAAGVPVISTPIRDVVDPYGTEKLVSICSTVEEFIEAADMELSRDEYNKSVWLLDVDCFLSTISWDKTTLSMLSLINNYWDQKLKSFSESAYV
ncbi:glycosyltransferase [Daejeonella sp.]|uniref:glycosyltransferase n=1 Tax=Daejeonella sp. TaxID=2805397 RepID=UPI0039836184